MCYNNYSSNTNRNNNINIIDNTKQIMSNNSSNNSNGSNNSNINNRNNIINSNSIKDNFRTPLTPLHRGGRERLHKGGIKGVYSRGLEVSAFSLIELSIVLIIIGLLVAGVTGGKSLIESAKQRAFINELNGLKQAVFTFYASHGRLPGDIKNFGGIGTCGSYAYGSAAKYTYTKDDFAPPYNTGSFVPDARSAPFIELYTEGIYDFKPIGNSGPMSKYATNNLLGFDAGGCGRTGDFMTNIPKQNKNNIEIRNQKYQENKKNNIKLMKSVDEKIDDGVYKSGIFRSGCTITLSSGYWETGYKEALNTDTGFCNESHYFMGI